MEFSIKSSKDDNLEVKINGNNIEVTRAIVEVMKNNFFTAEVMLATIRCFEHFYPDRIPERLRYSADHTDEATDTL